MKCAACVCLLAASLTATLISAQELSKTEHEEEYFLHHIFTKYGNKGKLSFEGLEHLMESLGLGNLKFDKNHNVSMHKTEDGGFKEVHDQLHLHAHNHTIRKRNTIEEKCLKPEELLKLYGYQANHNVEISPSAFLHICPAIVYQLDNRVCASKVSMTSAASLEHHSEKSSKHLSWLFGIVSILIMSAVGLFGVLIVPILEKGIFQRIVSLLAALAVGTLAGDALLHLLPHALMDKESSEEMVVLRCSSTFLTLFGFFVLEAVLRLNNKRADEGAKKEIELETLSHQKDGHNHAPPSGGITSVALMVITGDGLHNLTDGLAIGAAFSQHQITGLATALAVFAHELPHELGDFAVLLKSGMTLKMAVITNIFSSLLSLVGVTLGLIIGDYTGAALWIYSITAGSFLYIALATMVPELHKYAHSTPHLFLQFLGVFLGGAIMFVIALYEHSLQELLGAPAHE